MTSGAADEPGVTDVGLHDDQGPRRSRGSTGSPRERRHPTLARARAAARWHRRPRPGRALIAAAQAQFAGMTFRHAGPVDAHHDQARFTWELGPDGDAAVVIGSDVALRDADGRLALVLGFLDKVPSP